MRNRLLAVISIFAFLVGCLHYSAAPGSSTFREPLQISPIANHSELPQIIPPLARDLRDQLTSSRTWRLVENNSGNTLKITLLQPTQRALSRDSLDTGRPLSIWQTLTVRLEWDGPSTPPWGNDPVHHIDADSILYATPSRVDARAHDVNRLAAAIAAEIYFQLHRNHGP